MRTIQQLPPLVVNQIAAGEVIERPASVVKELVENSVDAGARRIDVAVVQGGLDLVEVADDGHGIPAEQLPLAVASHATSKLRTADDLFQVGTLGFRGEALASIAAVSQFRVRSRTADSAAGAELAVHGGQPGDVAPCGCPVGTSVTARNLFFNTPVRRRFLRTVQTEMGHVSEALTRIALPYHKRHFTLRHNDRQIHDLPPVADWRQRISALFGRELADELIDVREEQGQVRMHGFVANPSQNRGNNRMQYLFLNGRHIRDKALSHALSEAYRGLLMTGRHAIAFLCLEMPAELVDVNVHPTKLEVRFQDGSQLYGQLLRMLRSRFLSSELTAQARLSEPDRAAGGTDPAAAGAKPPLGSRTDVNRWAETQAFRKFPELLPERTGHQSSLDLQFPSASTTPPVPPSVPVGDRPSAEPPPRHPGPSPRAAAEPPRGGTRTVLAEGVPAMQVYNRYLITETDEGVVVIDQHALHERILYEEIREKVTAGAVEKQKLLVPEPVQLTPAEAAAILENRETLGQLGMVVESFGGDTVLVEAYPAMLANWNPSEIVRQVAELLITSPREIERRDVLDRLLHMISCKAAIKAGDRLTSEEITALLERRHVVQDAHHCPHGRPTALIFSRDELDRRFKRT